MFVFTKFFQDIVPSHEDILGDLQAKIKVRSELSKSVKQLEKPKSFNNSPYKKKFPHGTYKGGVNKKTPTKPASDTVADASPKPAFNRNQRGGRGGRGINRGKRD